MKAVMLVGGEGTRLRPLTLDMPKQLLPVAGETMLERSLAPLARAGVREVVLSLGYRPDAFIQAFPGGKACGVPLSYAVEPSLLGTGGAVRFAAYEADMAAEPIVVHNGDVITELDLVGLQDFHKVSGGLATIALTAVDDPSSFGVVVAGEDGQVISFIEKPPAGSVPSNLVSAGTYILEPEVIERIPSGRPVSIEREIFPMLAEEGSLFALHCGGYWLDAGTPEKYLRANRDVLLRRNGGPPAAGAASLGAPSDGAWGLDMADTAGVLPAQSVLRSVLLQQAILGDHIELAECSVGKGAVISTGSRVMRSVILDGAQIGTNSVIEDSIIGRNASIGNSARVTGWSVIGSGAKVASGVILHGARLPE